MAGDDVCQVIMKKEQYLNLLFMSQANTQSYPVSSGFESDSPLIWITNQLIIPFADKASIDTMEKLLSKNAIFYYSRVRFTVNLIPYMKKAPILRHCVFCVWVRFGRQGGH